MIKKITTLFIACALLVACSKNALTGKNQLTLLPETELQTMAIGEYQQFLSSNKVVASTNNKDAEMVKRVGNRIVKAVEEYYAEKGLSEKLAGFKWEVNLVDDKAAKERISGGSRGPCRNTFLLKSWKK